MLRRKVFEDVLVDLFSSLIYTLRRADGYRKQIPILDVVRSLEIVSMWQAMGETGLVPPVEEDGNNFKMFELMYATVSKDVWQPLIPVGSWGPPDVSYIKISFNMQGKLI